MSSEKVLDISWGTILKIAIGFLGFYLIYMIREILIWIIFAIIISLLFNPMINFLQRRKVPRALATTFVYVSALGILGLMIYLTAPIFIIEIQQFGQLFPQYFEKMAPSLKSLGMAAFESFDSFIKVFQDWFVKASSSVFGAIAAIFGGIFSTLTIFTLALFISLEEGGVEKTIGLFSPKAKEAYVLSIWKSCQNKVAGWFGAKIMTCLFIGVFSFLALYLFKVDYPLALALVAGITNIVPIIGPIIAGIIIFIFAALDSWFKAFFVLIVFVLLQQIEGNIITPILTKKFIGLPPVLVLISLLVGGQLLGITGAILTIPFTGVIYEFLKDYLKKKKEPKTEPL